MPDDNKDVANLPVLYVNSIRLALSFTDLRLFLGEAMPAKISPELMPTMVNAPATTVDRICVVISPDAIPAIAAGLLAAAKQYEANFGPLRKPPQQPQMTAQPEAATSNG